MPSTGRVSADNKTVTVDAIAIIAASAFCYVCMPKGPKGAVHRKKRELCIQRGAHRPTGPTIPHEHLVQPMRQCRDCDTLVMA